MTRKLALRGLATFWLGLAAYCLLSLLAGPGGFFASASIVDELVAMRANLESLRAENGQLSVEVESLRSDPDRARREALSLGYLGKGEFEVVLPGGEAPKAVGTDTGKIVFLRPPSFVADADIKATSLLLALAFFAWSTMREAGAARATRRLRRRSSAKVKVDERVTAA